MQRRDLNAPDTPPPIAAYTNAIEVSGATRMLYISGQVGRGFVSAYSQNEVAGTMQRLRLPSHPRQCGSPMLRMLVIGAPPNCGGPRIPQRAMTSSRSPSAPRRTIGATWSGKTAGNSGACSISGGTSRGSPLGRW